MSREIVEAMRVLEQEKGIAPDTLKSALEDALLSAYKKSPGSAKYARVDLDEVEGEYRVFELILPPELEEKLVAEAREAMEAAARRPSRRSIPRPASRASPRIPISIPRCSPPTRIRSRAAT